MAAAVVLPSEGLDGGYRSRRWLAQVRDSKLVPALRREKLATLLRRAALGVGVGSASHDEIDEMGIVPATRLAMGRAIAQITPNPEYVLVDAVALPQIPMPHKAVIHGDALCFSIAAASIIAKVARDRIMVELDDEYPGYGFAAHKGYPTKAHLERLRLLGPSPVHRRCYAPVRRLLEGARG
jgi:ribonuclease HII